MATTTQSTGLKAQLPLPVPSSLQSPPSFKEESDNESESVTSSAAERPRAAGTPKGTLVKGVHVILTSEWIGQIDETLVSQLGCSPLSMTVV